MLIANDFAKEFNECEEFDEVCAIKGFLNFKLSSKYLLDKIDKALNLDIEFAKEEPKTEQFTKLEAIQQNKENTKGMSKFFRWITQLF